MLLDLFWFLWWGPDFTENPDRTVCSYRRDFPDFDPIDPGETDVFTIEFTADLLNGRRASNPVFTCSVLRTDIGAAPDTSPSSRIYKTALISTMARPVPAPCRTFANQRLGGFVSGNLYSIVATVTTSDGCTVQRTSRVYCRAPR
jgi:hypothetical protein